jgi:hypothetical protein
MQRARRKPWIPAATLLAAALMATAAPFTACGSRSGSCPGFDSCSDAKVCPVVRCACSEGAHSFPAKCGTDGTCFTASDCEALCVTVHQTCPKPPTACDSYLANECECASTTRYAEAWDCVNASQPAVTEQDCVDACGSALQGAGGTGGALPGVGGFGGTSPSQGGGLGILTVAHATSTSTF